MIELSSVVLCMLLKSTENLYRWTTAEEEERNAGAILGTVDNKMGGACTGTEATEVERGGAFENGMEWSPSVEGRGNDDISGGLAVDGTADVGGTPSVDGTAVVAVLGGEGESCRGAVFCRDTGGAGGE